MLDETQRRVLRGILFALVTTLAVLFVALGSGVSIFDHAQRERTAAWTGTMLALPLFFTIAALARFRFFSPTDIHGGGLTSGSERVRVLQAVLQNTLEQVVLAALVHGVWVMILPIRYLAVSVAASMLFLLGRVLFVWGYAKGAPSRAFGFGLTFYPTVAMLIAALIVLLGLWKPG